MTLDVKKFWMVYGVGQRSPSYCHNSKQSAKSEAARLAKQNPGVIFVVLSSVGAFMAEVPQVKSLPIVNRLADDEIPF